LKLMVELSDLHHWLIIEQSPHFPLIAGWVPQ
jgi:hypothetical protein